MNTILVTGAAGFIGSNLVKRLVEDKYFVIGVDNFDPYYSLDQKRKNISNILYKKNFILAEESILNFKRLSLIFDKYSPDVVIHLAAKAGVRPSILDPYSYQKVNVEGTLNMLEIVKDNDVKKFIFASSSSVYGNQKKTPFSESDPIHKPISPYAATKVAAEGFVYTYSNLYRIPSIILRFFTVYGPSGRPDMAPYIFTDRIFRNKPLSKYGDGSSARDYTYISDVVKGICASISYDTIFDVFNLGNSYPVTLNRYIDILQDVTKKNVIVEQKSVQLGDVDITYADISKAQKYLNYDPEVDLKTGLKKLVEWYIKNNLQSI